MKPVVILGTGLAGYTLAREIRRLNTELPLTLITADDGSAYSKPMLSNALTRGKTAAQLVSATAAQMAEQLDASIETRTTVVAIDREKKTVRTDHES
jgi:rubredoxin-NAD+ reductase